MASIESQIIEIEDQLRHVPAAKLAGKLGQIANLFLQDAAGGRAEHVDLFDRILNSFMAGIETKALASLSQRLAAIADAPVKVVRRLAIHDDISVAEPVLLHSPCIDDAALNEIARSKSQSHLLAIACRPRLNATVTDMLIARDDAVVIRYAANNPGAQFSEAGYLALVKLSKNDGALAELVKHRSDIPQRILKAG